jgi:ribonucleoside-diphosphate reductase alpha chain
MGRIKYKEQSDGLLSRKIKTYEYFNEDELARDVFLQKYMRHDDNSPEDLFEGIINEFYEIEKTYPNPLSKERIKELLDRLQYLVPAGSILYGLPRKDSLTSLSNCFVVGNQHDSYGGIMAIDQELAQIMKRRGGAGTDLSHFRESGVDIKNSAIYSQGIVPWMKRFSNTTLEVAQDGRRGALMLTLDINHPDIYKFISAKSDVKAINGANVSVKIPDSFMDSIINILDIVKNRKEDVPSHKLSDLLQRFNEENGESFSYIFEALIRNAWQTAEPGILFWDRIKRESPADCYENFQTISTNPCGEVPLCYYDSCRLMSINLYSLVDNKFTNKAVFNWKKLEEVAYDSQRLMDDLIDAEINKIDEILNKIKKDPEPDDIKATELKLWTNVREKAVNGRRTGLGYLGLADAFAALGIKYDSDDARVLADEITRTIAINSYKSSIVMAHERGSFPDFLLSKELDHPFIERILNELDQETVSLYSKYGRRNIANLSIAPTGSISILTQTTSGIEPVFSVVHKRRKIERESPAHTWSPGIVMSDGGTKMREYTVYHPRFLDYAKIKLNVPDPLLVINTWTKKELDKFIKDSPYGGSSAHEINPMKKVEMQGFIQKWIDHSISVTHNLPSSATELDVVDLIIHAYESGCKGVTIYRDGCRSSILVSDNHNDIEYNDASKRPELLYGNFYKIRIKSKKYIVAVGLFEDINNPYEIFVFPIDNELEKSFNKLLQYDFSANGYDDNGNIIPYISDEIAPEKYDFSTGYIQKLKGKYNILNNEKELIIDNFTAYVDSIEEEFISRLISIALRHRVHPRFVVEQLAKPKAGGITHEAKAISRILSFYVDKFISKEACPACGQKLIFSEGCLKCTCGYSRC